MSTPPDVGAAVVGGGIAGLGAALTLQGAGREVIVFDASDRPGGVLRTDHVGGYVVERGPNTIQVKAPLLGALREHRLDEALMEARPTGRLRFILHGGELQPVPTSPLAFARTPLLSARGKWRALAEPFVRRRDAGDDSVAEFVGRRLGREVATNLVGPFLTGVYAGDEERLGAEAVFPQLVDLERRYGSLVLGGIAAALARRGERGLRGTWSAEEGFGPFARHLAERLAEPPALGATVTGLRREGDHWRLAVSSAAGESEVCSERVVLAVPGPEAAKLLRPVDVRSAELIERIEYAPIVSLPLGVERSAVRRAIEGFGFLVPRDAGLRLLGCLFMSQLFPGRAPEGSELLQCMLGGVRWTGAVDEPEDRLVEAAARDLDRVLGLECEPQNLGAARWPRAIPQPGRDHPRRLALLRERLAQLPGLAVAGSWVAGVSAADTFASGLTAAHSL